MVTSWLKSDRSLVSFEFPSHPSLFADESVGCDRSSVRPLWTVLCPLFRSPVESFWQAEGAFTRLSRRGPSSVCSFGLKSGVFGGPGGTCLRLTRSLPVWSPQGESRRWLDRGASLRHRPVAAPSMTLCLVLAAPRAAVSRGGGIVPPPVHPVGTLVLGAVLQSPGLRSGRHLFLGLPQSHLPLASRLQTCLRS